MEKYGCKNYPNCNKECEQISEFNLSEKIEPFGGHLQVEEVKEFIRLLKEDIKTSELISPLLVNRIIFGINLLAGEDLI